MFFKFALAATLMLAGARPALAQRFPFERTFDVTGPPTLDKLDVSTERGRIEIVAGSPGRIVVTGTVTVRTGFDVPANAIELAQKLATAPPVGREGDTVKLRPPSDAATRRAVTMSYQVRVPPATAVTSVSDSGATTVRGVSGAVDVKTQSAAIDLASLGGAVTVSTGSGAVKIDGAAGALTVRTSSSSITVGGLGSSLHARTESGQVDAAFTGDGDADVETSSSAIRVRGLRGGITAKTQSGHVTIDGTPVRPWTVTTGSSAIDVTVPKRTAFAIDASSGSGSVTADAGHFDGSMMKGEAKGLVNGGGPPVILHSRSGSIHVASR